MRTIRFSVAVVAGLMSINAGAALAGSADAAQYSCKASIAADPSFQASTATTTDENGAVSTSSVQTLVEGDDLTVIHPDRIEFYRIIGPNKVELIGAIERPADLTADASTNGCS